MIAQRAAALVMSPTSILALALAIAACDSKESAPAEAPTAEPPRTETTPTQKEPAADEAPPQEAETTEPAQAELGKPAPDFTLTAVDGKSYKLSDLKGRTVVLQWFNPDCPFVKFAHTKGPLATLAKETAGEKLVWLSINSNAEGKQGYGLERNKKAVQEYKMANPILLDPSGEVGKAYQAEKTPHMFIIDSEGTLVYRGGLDNAPMGTVDPQRPRYEDSEEDALINYIKGALADLEQQRELRLTDTPAYGCSVKYES